jgi:hypothetical protein
MDTSVESALWRCQAFLRSVFEESDPLTQAMLAGLFCLSVSLVSACISVLIMQMVYPELRKRKVA